MDVDDVISKKDHLDELMLQREVMDTNGELHSKEGQRLMAAISKLSLEVASAAGTMVENFDKKMKELGSGATSRASAGDVGDEEYPLSMKTFSRVIGTLAQHHDNHITAHSQIAMLENRVGALEKALAKLN